jgi:hypothetical protein
MAILKQRLNRKNDNGTYDTIYLETIATVIKMSDTDNTLLSSKIANMDTVIAGKQPAGSYAAASHNHDDRYYTESEVNNLLNGKQNADSAINTSNIGSQSVNYSNSAGSAIYAANSNNYGQVLRNQGLSSSAATPSVNGEIIWQYS